MKPLKNLRESSEISFDKYTQKIKLCCNLFFEYVNSSIRATIPEYQEANIHDNDEGILYCPKCIVKRLRK